MAEHVFNPDVYHHAWDREIPSALTVQPGDVVHFDLLMAGERQIADGYSHADCSFDFDTLYNLAGPIDVAGAEVGDSIEVEIVSLETGPYGWCAMMAGTGLLPDDFPEPYVHHFDLTQGSTTKLCDGVDIPIVPFCGTMGTAPDRPGQFAPFPPHEGGGNIDTRHIVVGTKLYLPVHLPGGKFSFGDPHAAQGDGEVCVAAIECGMKATLKFGLVKGRSTPPWFLTPPGSLTPRSDVAGYYGTTGISSDLMEGARMAVRQMIELLGHEHGLDARMAYMLCSLAGDLKIYEIVDMGVWNVGMTMPRVVFS